MDSDGFMKEFEALKARYGAEFADIQAVRFVEDGKPVTVEREFIPYSCRTDSNGFILCEKERQT